jgi:hypothetical protein
MARSKKPPPGGSTNKVRLPDLEKIFALPCSEQVEVYSKAAAQLDPNIRGALKRRGAARFDMGDIERYLAAIRDHWENERQRCRDNPDYFTWPSTQAWLSDGKFTDLGLEDEGALKLFGYAVSSEAGLSQSERHYRLHVVFRAVIPPFTSWPKVMEWGEPETPPRLRKMANCLAAFARNGARRSEAWMAVPVDKWRADLAHLRKRYYQDLFGFDWPTIA